MRDQREAVGVVRRATLDRQRNWRLNCCRSATRLRVKVDCGCRQRRVNDDGEDLRAGVPENRQRQRQRPNCDFTSASAWFLEFLYENKKKWLDIIIG